MKNKTFEVIPRIPLEKKKEILRIPDDVDLLCRKQVAHFRDFSPYYIEKNFQFGPSEILMRFQGDKVANVKNYEGFNERKLIRVRCEAMASIIGMMWKDYSEIMSDMDLIVPVSFSDMATSPRQEIPSLTFCKETSSNNILIPSVNNLAGYAEIQHVSMDDSPLLNKDTKMCFVGSLTNIRWNEKGVARNQRLQIASKAVNNPNMFARLIPPKDFDEEQFGGVYQDVISSFPNLKDSKELSTEKNRESIQDQLKHRFHLCVDGHVCAWARLPWHLYANVVPIKIRNPDYDFMEWYYPLLDKSTHCVETGIDELDEVYEYLCQNVEAQIKIAQEGRKFVEKYVNQDLGRRILLWTILLLSERQQLYLSDLE